MNNRARWFAAAAATSLAAGPAAAEHQWGSYHWNKTGSEALRLDVLRQMGSQWDKSYTTAVADWDLPNTLVLDLAAETTNAGVSARKCDPISGKVLVCADSYGYRGWLGIASIWTSGGHIVQGTSKMNDSYFNLASYDTPAWRSLVMCQEIGHDFGLDHQDEDFNNRNLGTCQDYTNDPDGGDEYGPSNEHPNDHDYDMLEDASMYGHDHGGEGGEGGGGGGGCNPRSPKCNGQDAFAFREVRGAPEPGSGASSSQWGQAIDRDGAGRPDTFMLDLGGGRRKITHVFWVPGFRPQAHHFGDPD